MAKCINCFGFAGNLPNKLGFAEPYCEECEARLIAAYFNRFYNQIDPGMGRDYITEDNRIIDAASGQVLSINDAVDLLMFDYNETGRESIT